MKDGSASVGSSSPCCRCRSVDPAEGARRGQQAAPQGRHGALGAGARANGTFTDALTRARGERGAHGGGERIVKGGPPASATHEPAHAGTAPRGGRERTLHERDTKHASQDDPLDPSARRAAQLAPPPVVAGPTVSAPPPPAPIEAGAHASLETLLPALVRRIAWSGDARRGAVRLEVGAGAMAGGTLLVEANDGRVHVRISAPAGADAAAWRDRIARRLEERGIDVEAVIVD
jgi:hypothetical protein